MIRFAYPQFLFLLLLLPVIIYFLRKNRHRSTPKMLFSSLELLGPSGSTLKAACRPVPKLLSIAALVLLIMALARPQSPWSEHHRNIRGIDIMLVLDVSESMRALDFNPNRLEKSKEVVKEFIQSRTEDQVGIVIFARETFTLCPLSYDYSAIDSFVDRIDFNLVDGQKTAIGMGLANAVNKLKDSKAKSKVVILLTDGENNWGEIDPITAAGLAYDLDIRVYTIGVGSKGDVLIPVRNTRGVFQTKRVPSQIDTSTLEKVAETTGGKFFLATDGEKLKQIYDQIDQMERTVIEVTETNYFDELAQWLLLPALVMAGLAWFLEQTWLWSFP